MVGKQSIFQLARRVGKKETKNIIRAFRIQEPTDGAEKGSANPKSKIRSFMGRLANVGHVMIPEIAGGIVLLKNPRLALGQAAAAGAYTDLAKDIAKVTELGIPINVVVSHNDELFDSDKFNNCLEEIFNNASTVDSDAVRGDISLHSVNDEYAGHDAFFFFF